MEADFPDIHINTKCFSNLSTSSSLVTFSISMHRKPSFVLHHLPCNSQHPIACKLGIFTGEAKGSLALCTEEGNYNDCIAKASSFLEIAGYPARTLPSLSLDQQLRQSYLDRASSSAPALDPVKDTVFLILDFTENMALCLPRLFRETLCEAIRLRLVMACGMKPNSMRLLYAMNWPHGQRPYILGRVCKSFSLFSMFAHIAWVG